MDNTVDMNNSYAKNWVESVQRVLDFIALTVKTFEIHIGRDLSYDKRNGFRSIVSVC